MNFPVVVAQVNVAAVMADGVAADELELVA